MLDLNAIDQQYQPLEDLLPQMKAARKDWATAVNALDAAQTKATDAEHALTIAASKVQFGPFPSQDQTAWDAFNAAQHVLNEANEPIPALQTAVATNFINFNALYAKWKSANGVLLQNPGQVEQIQQ